MRYLLLILLLLLYFLSPAQQVISLSNLPGNLKSIPVVINSHNYLFLFDTGGGETFISPRVLNAMGKRIHGKSIGLRMSGEKIAFQHSDSITISLGSRKIFLPSVGVWDVMSLLPKDFPQIEGIISLKTFSNQRLTIDFSTNSIMLETPRSFKKKIKKATLVPSKVVNGISGEELLIFLGLRKENSIYWFLFDSANLDLVRLSPQTAYEWGLIDADQIGRNEFKDQLIELGNHRFNTNVASMEIIYDGALNYEVIRQVQFYIDLTNNKVWIN